MNAGKRKWFRTSWLFCLSFGAISLSWAAAEFKPGGMYCIPGNTKSIRIAKVLAVDPKYVHMRFYDNRFLSCPLKIDPKSLQGPLKHTPLLKKIFLSPNRFVFIMQSTTSVDELAPYYQWKRTNEAPRAKRP